MAEIVNLRRARKRARKEMEDKNAADRRVAFGRTKIEQEMSKAEKEIALRHIDGHKLSDEP